MAPTLMCENGAPLPRAICLGHGVGGNFARTRDAQLKVSGSVLDVLGSSGIPILTYSYEYLIILCFPRLTSSILGESCQRSAWQRWISSLTYRGRYLVGTDTGAAARPADVSMFGVIYRSPALTISHD